MHSPTDNAVGIANTSDIFRTDIPAASSRSKAPTTSSQARTRLRGQPNHQRLGRPLPLNPGSGRFGASISRALSRSSLFIDTESESTGIDQYGPVDVGIVFRCATRGVTGDRDLPRPVKHESVGLRRDTNVASPRS
jgi:hypothetical protein